MNFAKYLLIAVVCVFPAATASAQGPKTVTDYFLAFPDTEYATSSDGTKFESPADLAKFRRSLIKVEDVKNGYLKLQGSWEGWSEVALFKKSDGSYVIAHTMVECGPACTGTLAFSEYKDGQWNDVTSGIFPAPDKDDFKRLSKTAGFKSVPDNSYYSLPQKGTDILLKCSMCRGTGDATLGRYVWAANKFVLK